MDGNYFAILWHGSGLLSLLLLIYFFKLMVLALRGKGKKNVAAAITAGLVAGLTNAFIMLWYSVSYFSSWMLNISMSARYIFAFVVGYLLALILGGLFGYLLRNVCPPKAVINMSLISASLITIHPIALYWLQKASGIGGSGL